MKMDFNHSTYSVVNFFIKIFQKQTVKKIYSQVIPVHNTRASDDLNWECDLTL